MANARCADRRETTSATTLKPLSAKQWLFVDQYMVDRNGTQAAIRAGYSPKSAKVTACRMLTNANVKAEIDRRVEEYSRTAGIAVVDLLEIGKKLVTADIRKLFDENGRLLHPTMWPDDVAPAVAGMDLVEEFGLDGEGRRAQVGWTKKVRMIDKSGPLFKLLDFIAGRVPAPASVTNITNNVQVNADQALVELRAVLFGDGNPDDTTHHSRETQSGDAERGGRVA